MTRLLLIGLLVIAPADAAQPRPAARETAQAVQQKYDRVKDFSADFSHTYEGGVLKKTVTERGSRSRSQARCAGSTAPDKAFVFDGTPSIPHPRRRQAIRSPRRPMTRRPLRCSFRRQGQSPAINVTYADGAADWLLALRPIRSEAARLRLARARRRREDV